MNCDIEKTLDELEKHFFIGKFIEGRDENGILFAPKVYFVHAMFTAPPELYPILDPFIESIHAFEIHIQGFTQYPSGGWYYTASSDVCEGEPAKTAIQAARDGLRKLLRETLTYQGEVT